MFCHHRAGWGGERHGNTTMSIRAIHIRIGEFPGTCLAAGSPTAMRSISSLRRAQDSPNGRPYGHLPGGHPVKALPFRSLSIELPLLQSTTKSVRLRGSSRSQLDGRSLGVLLCQTCADFLVLLGMGFFAISRAIRHAFAHCTWLQDGRLCVFGRLCFVAVAAKGCG